MAMTDLHFYKSMPLRTAACRHVSLIAFAAAACLAPAGFAADLTISDGAVVKFGNDTQLVVRDKLVVGKNITFTSQKDDSRGGQTNATAQTPAAGDWRGIRVEKSALAFGVQIGDSALIRYAGGAGNAGLTLRGPGPTINFLQLNDNLIGMRLLQGAAPHLSGASVIRNGIGIDVNENAAPVITGSQFGFNTTGAVINNSPSTVVQATTNWWGAASGPKDSVGNPQGQGDAVSAGVNYGQFLTQLALVNPSIQLAAPAAYFDTSKVDVLISCINASEYRIAENGTFTGVNFQPLDNGQASVNVALSSGDGHKQLTVQFRSADGTLATAVLNGGVVVDTTAPQLSITNPVAGSTVDKPISVTATASDANGIDHVDLYLDGVFKGKLTSSPYSYSWATDTVANGAHSWRMVAFDSIGRSTERVSDFTFTKYVAPLDTAGPVAMNLNFAGSALASGTVLTKNGTVTAALSDASGVARVELLLDGVVVGTMSGSAGSYSALLNLDAVANGIHALAIRATDSVNNVSTSTLEVTVTHAAPTAPTIAPPGVSTTRYAAQTITGQAPANSKVQPYVNGAIAGSLVTATAGGTYSAPVTLVPGLNTIQATASDAFGTSALSSAVSMTLDTSIPAAPTNLAAAAQAGGKIRLSWLRSSDANVSSVAIYRSASAFTSISEASKINTLGASVTTYDDMPASDGSYFYRAVALNAAATPSEPTAQVQARADSSGPRASIAYAPQGKTDAATGRIGQGLVNVTLTVTEALQAAPYLAVVPNGTAPVSVTLVRQDDTHYTGSFVIDSTVGSGTANALFSGRDTVGNRGTDIDAGATLKIDTEGPSLTGIAVSPVAPIKNDTAQTISATLTLSKEMKPGEAPRLSYLLSGPVRSPVAVSGATQVDATTWRAVFTLPADAGAGSPETFVFSYRGIDALDNVSTRISAAGNRYQVYQGSLPPLDVPLGFKAEARPGGKVALSWQAVDQAAAYQIYRQGAGDATLLALQRTSGVSYIDTTPQDGKYKYAVATVRQSNGQESLSGQTAAIEVSSSSNAPGAPQNLALSVTGAGVQATWQAPLNSSVATYNLYRSSAASISSISGLTPIKTGIKTTATVDGNPSPSEHAYVVTAVDGAGNESAMSNSAYLNSNLLPVATIKVERIGDGLPQLSWTSSKSSNAGYNVYIGPEGGQVKLTPSPTAALSFTDSGFSGGERRYTVSAVDNNGVEQPRTLALPNASAQIVSGMPIKRGVMNKLQVQVANASSSALANATVIVRINGQDHKSEEFSLAANEIRIVPVVVGGYETLQANAPLQLIIESVPNEGELVRLSQSSVADVIDGSLVVGMATEDFTRGGTGKVHLTIENTTEVDIDLLTARNNGAADSDEMRFKLLDSDGNVLATQPYKQVFGANVVTLSSGQTVARIPAGASYVSDTFAVTVPNTSVNSLRVRLEVDKLHYHTGQPDQVVIAGHGSEKTVSLLDVAYTGKVTDVNPVSSFGEQDVTITGRALARGDGNVPLPNTRLRLVLNQQGFERVFSVLTDSAGSFSYVFKPTMSDSGLYKVSAVHPDMTDRPEQKAFTINRVTVTPALYQLNIPKNYNFIIPFAAKAGPGTAATNLRLVLAAASQPTGQIPAGVSAQLAAPVSLAERQTLNIPATFTAGDEAQPSGTLIFDVLSDEHASTPIGQVRVDYALTEAKPFLTSSPSFVETGVAQGASQTETVTIENKGLQEATNLQFTLTKPDGSPAPAWIGIGSQIDGTLAVGDKRVFDLNFTPPAGTADGVYEYQLNVKGGNLPAQTVKIYASVTQSGQGNVLFKASDMYTATIGKDGKLIPGLGGATITVQNEDVATVTREVVTDSVGEALFSNLPAGSYKFRAKASNHQEVGGRLLVKAGITGTQAVFLGYNVVTVEWSVREITIQDRYEITLNATYETDVPTAVVVMLPASVNLPVMKTGDVYYGELSLTNFGLVRADNVKQTLPASDSNFRFEFLAEVPSTLAAKQRISIPYRVIALKSLDAAAAGSASGGGCLPPYRNSTGVSYECTCANGSKDSGAASTSFVQSPSNDGSCIGSGLASSGLLFGEGGVSGGGFSSNGSTATKVPLKGKKCVTIPRGSGGTEAKPPGGNGSKCE